MTELIDRAFGRANREKPDVFLFGGDNVMAVDGGKTREVADAQFGEWKRALSTHVKRPAMHVIGNHDIWGWPSAESPDAGKKLAIETFSMPKRYYEEAHGGWRFFLLDSFHPEGCLIDEEQMGWLKERLSATREPVVIVTHAPILSVTHFLEKGTLAPNGWAVPASWQTRNTIELRDLLLDVKRPVLALSGHMHQIDRVEFRNVTYVCGGAVSGAWWAGSYLGFAPAFLTLDLLRDGTFEVQTIAWEEGDKLKSESSGGN